MIRITIVFSPHWIEAIPFMKRRMKESDAIILEEPSNKFFERMLNGILAPDDYIHKISEETYVSVPAFPKFTERLCEVLREMRDKGKRILQVEPYFDALERIYELIDARGKESIRDILRDPVLGPVYKTEKDAYVALYAYYMTFSSSFGAAVESVMEYAKVDSRRIKLRLDMRSRRIAELVKSGELRGRIYIEAGDIHQPLQDLLRDKIDGQIDSCFALEKPSLEISRGEVRFPQPPGDVLTLMYYRGERDPEKERLLAARSIIKIILQEREKEKVPSEKDPFPHLAERIFLIKLVNKLDYAGCRELFYKIRGLPRERAKKIAREFIGM